MFLIPNLSISCLSLRPFLWVFSLQAQQKILDPTLLTISFQAVAEGNEDSSEPPLLQDKHPQLPQVFLRRSDLQMLDEPCCPFLDVVQLFKVLFEVGGSELNTLLHNANPSPSPAGYTVPDTGLHLSANLKNIFIYFLVFCLWNIKCSNAKLIQFLGRTFIFIELVVLAVFGLCADTRSPFAFYFNSSVVLLHQANEHESMSGS